MYTKENLEDMKLSDIREIAKKDEIKSITKYKKQELIEMILEIENSDVENDFDTEEQDENFDLGEKFNTEGLLQVFPDGYGFLRPLMYESSSDDIYISPIQIRRFKLKTGDYIEGIARYKKDKDKYSPLIYVSSVNKIKPGEAYNRPNFEDLTPIYPNERINLECDNKDYSTRIMDLVAPIGFGQRGLIVSPPKAGKTTLLKSIEKSVERNHDNIKIIVLLIDERPEEVTDIKRFVNQYRDESNEMLKTEVVASTFDEIPQNHINIAELVLERAKRFVEQGQNVMILLDSITRLSRAHNIMTPASGKTLSGGLDPIALVGPKKFFGAARNIEKGGSLTIIATTLVDTGSRMDDMIYEEFKGTGNMEVFLDRSLSEKRIFPAINVKKSGTRRDDLLQNKDEIGCMLKVRSSSDDDQITNIDFIKFIERTNSNSQFIKLINNQVKKL